LVRYRYRLDPTPAQQRQLARTFGCARWVYNECLRVRDGAHAGGEKVTDTEVQRRAVTLARQRAETAWLSEVASVPLVQACQDARRAYRNWFDSLRGQRKGRLLREKADQYGRQVVTIGRFEPTSQVCSACGVKDGPKPLGVREWTCRACGASHDRDANAARNVLVAAGLAETRNACGAPVRPSGSPARSVEAGTHRGAA